MGFHHETFHPCRCTRSRLGRSAMGRSTHVVAPVFGFASRAAPLSKPKIRVSVGRFAIWASYWINLHGTQAKRYHKPFPAGPVNETRPAEDVCQCLPNNRSWALKPTDARGLV